MQNTSLDELSNQLNSFNEEIPPWAALLIQSMNSVIKELKCVKDLAERVNELESFKTISETVTNNLQAENKRLYDSIKNLESKMDDQEQRSRNNCLLIHGVPESEDENTDKFALDVMNTQIGLLDIPKADISRSPRVGPKVNQRRNLRSSTVTAPRPRPIIVRFANWNSRNRVFRNKKKLKGLGVSISESLTANRLVILKAAEAKFGRGNVWSNEGFILTKVNNQYVTSSSTYDL